MRYLALSILDARRALFMALAVLSLSSAGCLFSRRNDPDARGAASVALDLGLGDQTGITRGSGRIWLRLIRARADAAPGDSAALAETGAGVAVERQLEFSVPPRPESDKTPAPSAAAVTLYPDLPGARPGACVFDDLVPGTWRLTSFLVSARIVRPTGEVGQMTLGGELEALVPVTVGAGELVDMGALALLVASDGRFDYRARADGSDERIAAAREGHADLASFRGVLRPMTGAAATGGGTGRAGQRPRAPTASAGTFATGATPASPYPTRPLGSTPTAALGVEAWVGETLGAGNAHGTGLIRLEVRRVGGQAERAVTEVGWELPSAPIAGAGAAGGPDTQRGARALRLFGLGPADDRPTQVVLPLALPPGEFQLVAITVDGTIESAGGATRVAATTTLTRYEPFEVKQGELADLGGLLLEVVESNGVRVLLVETRERLARARALGAQAAGIVPLAVARPLEAGVQSMGGDDDFESPSCRVLAARRSLAARRLLAARGTVAAARSLAAIAFIVCFLTGCEGPTRDTRPPAPAAKQQQPAPKQPAAHPDLPLDDDPQRPFVPEKAQHLGAIDLRLGGRWLSTEVARTEPERQTGLMFRRDLGADAGMLFVFPSADFRYFWMHNTPLPLSVAYVARDGTITQISDMSPLSDETTPSREQVPFVLEVHQGWFRAAGVHEGDRIEGLDRAGGGT